MQRQQLLDLLNAVQRGETSAHKALERLAQLPFAELDVARVDHHRSLRCGFSEVVFGPGKRADDLVRIVERALKGAPCVLVSRVSDEQARVLLKRYRKAIHNARARTVRIGASEDLKTEADVLVVTAGTSDIPVAEEAVETLRAFGCPCESIFDVGVAGLHRLLHVLPKLRTAGAIICVAGMEGALPSVVGGLVACPVIAVPTSVGYGANLQGLTPLLAMLNTCASGVSVVNIDNGFGAAMCALRIVAAQSERQLIATKTRRLKVTKKNK
ncbi:MAG TPA: nickel pincer cofactor biosynthesis protein LarB [Planctomycetota bacterium]|nr:nickel pincer cofactor biosynthesis protein LarB [Planctomycetota bacterium]